MNDTFLLKNLVNKQKRRTFANDTLGEFSDEKSV